MRLTFYTVFAYGTLLADAYLALASVATRMIRRAYLPPLGDAVSEGSQFLVLLVATWTGALALGCLRAGRIESERSHAPGIFWFVLVLAVIWLAFLLPHGVDLMRSLFVRGL